MRKPGWFVLVLGAVMAFGGPAFADHVINFTNGTSLPVRAYRVDDGTIHVDLGGNAFMAFPMELVEGIENPTRSLNLKPSTMHPDDAGPMIASSSRGGSSSRNRSGKNSKDSTRHALKNPGFTSDNPATNGAALQQFTGGAQQFNAIDSGARNEMNTRGGNGGLRGARRVGNKFVLTGQEGDDRPAEIQMRQGTGPAIRPGQTQPNPGSENPRTRKESDS